MARKRSVGFEFDVTVQRGKGKRGIVSTEPSMRMARKQVKRLDPKLKPTIRKVKKKGK